MLTHLRIENFKGWKDTGDLKLAPITLLFGGNSSGKSSLAHFLLMLKQTAESTDRQTTLQTEQKGSPITFGGFSDFIHKRKVSNKLTFSFGWTPAEPLTISNGTIKQWTVKELRFSCEIVRTSKKPYAPHVNEFFFEAIDPVAVEGRNMNKPLKFGMKYDPKAQKYQKIDSGFSLKQRNRGGSLIGWPEKFYRFPDQFLAVFSNASSCADFNFELEKLFTNISYLGPLRKHPERTYQFTGSTPDSVGYDGEDAIAALLSRQEKRYSEKQGGWRKTLAEVVAAKLYEMGLIHSFDVDAISEHAKLYLVKVTESEGGCPVDLPDVGFGISQVLPVIIQLFYAKPNSTVIIEQPELHLHPRAQALLADVFIDAIQYLDEKRPRNLQVLVETHSEHFLLRFQRRIAEGTLSPDSLAAYVAESSAAGSTLSPLDIGEHGEIRNWPENFFGDQMTDLAVIQKAAFLNQQ